MAAYAALLSVLHIIDQIQLHPRPPISLNKTQVESLTEKVNFLQEFLEGYSLRIGYSNEADGLESRIADAANAVEDVIESHIVDRILAKSTTHGGEEISSIDFYQNLEKVIEDMDLIKKEVIEIKEKMGAQDQPQRDSSISASSSGSASTWQSTMVGYDDVLLEILDKLTGGQSHRQIIPIAGMGGIGKTTLARNIYQNQVVVQHFDILLWVTFSQEYRMREILLELLQEGRENLNQMKEYELEEKLYKRLSGNRYLIVIDDIWDVEVWDHLKFLFPDNNNGSRIMITTRLSNLASQVANSPVINLAFLDENNSWDLFSKTVFGEEGSPLELEEIGKKIVKNCNGLPLSIVVIGGLLARFKHTREYWEYIAENLNSVVNSEDDERCLKILHMSYNQLPVYLKPCFLYMGVFSEDNVIRVSTLVKLWVAEGFLKPSIDKSLEVVAKEYLKDLIDRNLILVHKLGSIESIKYCSIHDLVRDLCLKEAQKERFYKVIRQHSLNVTQDASTQRRIVIPKSTSEEEVLDSLQSMPLARSLISDIKAALPLLNFKLLRTLKPSLVPFSEKYFLENMFHLVNLRYLVVRAGSDPKFPSSVYSLWNLQTLIVRNSDEVITAPAEIWSMPLLRHVDFNGKLHLSGGLHLPDPPQDDIVLGNLQTLEGIINFNCGEEVVKRIPNIKKLGIQYEGLVRSYFAENLGRRHEHYEGLVGSSPSHYKGSLVGRSRNYHVGLHGHYKGSLVGSSHNYHVSNLGRRREHYEVHVESSRNYHVNNLERLHKLENFSCKTYFREADILPDLTFPHSLKKLTLKSWHVHWEDMLGKIGSLPLLEKLKLIEGSFRGRKWETVDGQFHCLKFLLFHNCKDLEYWTTERSHFPRLERIVLRYIDVLEEIPSEIGEISTLKSIELDNCSRSAVVSAKKIVDELEDFYGDDVALQVRVSLQGWLKENKALGSLASPNFHIELYGL